MDGPGSPRDRYETLNRAATQRLVLGLRRGILVNRLADARDARADSEALLGQAQQIAAHAAATRRRRREPAGDG